MTAKRTEARPGRGLPLALPPKPAAAVHVATASASKSTAGGAPASSCWAKSQGMSKLGWGLRS